jgi:hypothetical protein
MIGYASQLRRVFLWQRQTSAASNKGSSPFSEPVLEDHHPERAIASRRGLVDVCRSIMTIIYSSYPIIGLLGQVEDELALRNIGTNVHSPMTAETSLAALSLSQCCEGLPIVDPFTAHFWQKTNAGRPRIISDLPFYRYALFESLSIGASMIDRELQAFLIEEIEVIKSWVDHRQS